MMITVVNNFMLASLAAIFVAVEQWRDIIYI